MNAIYLTSLADQLPSAVSNSRFSVLKNDSARALSQQFPFSSHALTNRGMPSPQRFPKAFRATPHIPVRVESPCVIRPENAISIAGMAV
jgi:hypothetical protein